MRLETEFFDLCGVVRDQYAREIRKAEAEHKAKAAEIARDFKGERARTENESNKVKLAEAKQTAAEKARKALEEAYTKAEIREKAAVSCVTVGADIMRALDALAGVPVSKEELAIIADGVADRGYWVNAKLRELAKANGVLTLPGLTPTYTERVQALTIARDRMLDYIEKGNIEDLNILVSDKALRGLESDFSGGFVHYNMSAEKQAALLLDKAKACGDPFSVAIFVKNALETASPEVKAEIVRSVSSESSYWRTVRELGGLSSVLDKVEKEEKQSEKDALRFVKDARLAGEVAKLTEAERAAALYGSAITPDNTGSDRKIDRQGLDFLTTEEGAAKVKEFERSLKKAEEAAADRAAEASKRAEIEGA